MPSGRASARGADPRRVAWDVLIAVAGGSFADAELGRRSAARLAERDRALLTRLVYGTLAWQGYLDELVYFGVPSTAEEQMSHISGFCAATQAKCIAPDAELLGELDNKAYWRNAGHVSFRGAKIYSRWLARALAKSGALVK